MKRKYNSDYEVDFHSARFELRAGSRRDKENHPQNGASARNRSNSLVCGVALDGLQNGISGEANLGGLGTRE